MVSQSSTQDTMAGSNLISYRELAAGISIGCATNWYINIARQSSKLLRTS